MKILYSLFKINPEDREGMVTVTSMIGVIVNILVALLKVVVGLLSSSIAIVSEGVNNAADALTSILTLIGTKLAGKHPDEKHPFGYGRIEYLTSLLIAILILVSGTEMLINAIKLIFMPEELKISFISLMIVAISAIIKYLLGTYTISMGKRAESSALQAVGIECKNDSFVSLLTIITSIIFIVFHISIDAYAGILISLIIIKAGLTVLMNTVSELIGRPGEHDLANKIYQEIRSTKGVLAAVDMMLHNYGPNAWSGSVNLEIDHEKTVGEIYQILHALQLKIMHEYHVTMVFGIYAVDNDHEEVRQLREKITEFVRKKEHVKSYHAVYLEPDTNRIYCDFIVDYKLKDWENLREEFTDYLKEYYPENELILTIETEFV